MAAPYTGPTATAADMTNSHLTVGNALLSMIHEEVRKLADRAAAGGGGAGGASPTGGAAAAAAVTTVADRLAAFRDGLSAVTGRLSDAAYGGEKMRAVLKGFGDDIQAVGNKLNGLANALRTPLTVLQTGIGQVNSMVTRFVAAVNPTAVKQWEYATRDLYAVIGRLLVPVLNNFTAIVRTIADGIAGLTPQGAAMIAAVIGAGVAMTVAAVAAVGLSTVINSATAGIPAILGALAGAFAGLGLALGSTGQIAAAVKPVMDAFRTVFDAVGMAVSQALSGMSGLAPVLAQAAEIAGRVAAVFGGALAAGIGTLVGVATALAPVVLTVAGAAGELVAALGDVVGVFAQAVGGIVSTVMDVLGPVLTYAAEIFSTVVRKIAAAIRWMVDQIRDFLGLQRLEMDQPKGQGDSNGAAVRNVQIGGVGSFVEQGYKNAFAMSQSAKPEDPGKSIGREISEWLAARKEDYKYILGKVDAIVDVVSNPVTSAKSTANLVNETVKSFPDFNSREARELMRQMGAPHL